MDATIQPNHHQNGTWDPASDPHDHHGDHRGWVRPGGRRGRWLEPFVLLLLTEGEAYGAKLIGRLNGLCLAPGDVDVGMTYRTPREFEAEGLLVSRWVTADNMAPRRTYRLTEAGREAFADWIEVMHERRRLVDAFLAGAGAIAGGEGG
jgi:DNA-binding PadR family transcriptional regulator